MGMLIQFEAAKDRLLAETAARVPAVTVPVALMTTREKELGFLRTRKLLDPKECARSILALRGGLAEGIGKRPVFAAGVLLGSEQLDLIMPILAAATGIRVVGSKVEFVRSPRQPTGWTMRCIWAASPGELREAARKLILARVVQGRIELGPVIKLVRDTFASAGLPTAELDDLTARLALSDELEDKLPVG